MTAVPGKPAANSVQSGQDQLLAVSPGERLQKARKERQLEIPQVAENLNLSPGVVRALEADDYRMLPNATFVKGYLRSYARLLGISGDDLVRGYEAITGHVREAKVEPVAPAMVRDNRSGLRNVMMAVVAVVIVVLGVWLSLSGDKAPEMEPALAEADQQPVAPDEAVNPPVVVSRSADTDAELQTLAEAAAEPLPDEPVEAEVPVPAEPAMTAAELAVVEQSPAVVTIPAEAAPLPVTEEPAASGVSPVAADGATGLVNLRFSGECWVEVRDGKGDLVFSSLKRAGQEVNLRAATPINVKLGNGDVVAVQYNHEPVAFTTRPDRKVVRLTLGQ
ncbi:MAG: DUF4115 domain-containing protein [Gammaproteobacteria bacterium]